MLFPCLSFHISTPIASTSNFSSGSVCILCFRGVSSRSIIDQSFGGVFRDILGLGVDFCFAKKIVRHGDHSLTTFPVLFPRG